MNRKEFHFRDESFIVSESFTFNDDNSVTIHHGALYIDNNIVDRNIHDMTFDAGSYLIVTANTSYLKKAEEAEQYCYDDAAAWNWEDVEHWQE